MKKFLSFLQPIISTSTPFSIPQKDFDTHLEAAREHLAICRQQLALEAFQSCLQFEKNHLEVNAMIAYLNGINYKNNNQYELAIIHFKEALPFFDNDVTYNNIDRVIVLKILAACCVAIGSEETVFYYAELMKEFSDDPYKQIEIRRKLITFYFAMNQHEKALPCIQTFLEQDSFNLWAQLKRAQVYATKPEWHIEALADCNKIISHYTPPTDPSKIEARKIRCNMLFNHHQSSPLTTKEYENIIEDLNVLGHSIILWNLDHSQQILIKGQAFLYLQKFSHAMTPYSSEIENIICDLALNNLNDDQKDYLHKILNREIEIKPTYLIMLGFACLQTSNKEFKPRYIEIKNIIQQQLHQNPEAKLNAGDQERWENFLKKTTSKYFSSCLFAQVEMREQSFSDIRLTC